MKLYGVTFTGDYYNLFTTITANDEAEAERRAIDNLEREYGFDIQGTYNEIEINLEGEYT